MDGESLTNLARDFTPLARCQVVLGSMSYDREWRSETDAEGTQKTDRSTKEQGDGSIGIDPKRDQWRSFWAWPTPLKRFEAGSTVLTVRIKDWYRKFAVCATSNGPQNGTFMPL